MELTSQGFEKFLAALAPNRDAAGEKYELVRLKLVKFFEIRMCSHPADLADVTMDRVARRLAEGERIVAAEVMAYVYGVARRVMLEHWKTERREERSGYRTVIEREPQPSEPEWDDRRRECQQKCLAALPDDLRSLLLRYYELKGRRKIERRAELARTIGVPLNALRIRIHRLKLSLQHCVEQCMTEERSSRNVHDVSATTDGEAR